MNQAIERRFIPLDRAELREVPIEGDALPAIEGYAVVYNSLSEDLGGFKEIIAPGAFDRNLPGADLRAFYGHDSKQILGRQKSGTLQVFPDSFGLRVRINLPNTSVGRDLVESLRRGDLDGMSFAAIPTKTDWHNTPGGPVCTILEAEIIEVSVVSIPAYSATSVSLRSLDKAKEVRRQKPNLDVLERLIKITSL